MNKRCRGCGGFLPERKGRITNKHFEYCTKACMTLRRTYVIEELDFLIGTDAPENLAERLGYGSVKALSQMLKREGRTDLIDQLNNPPESLLQSKPAPNVSVGDGAIRWWGYHSNTGYTDGRAME